MARSSSHHFCWTLSVLASARLAPGVVAHLRTALAASRLSPLLWAPLADDGKDRWRQLHSGRHVCVGRSAAGGRGQGGGEDEEPSHWGEPAAGRLHGEMPPLLQQPGAPEAPDRGHREQGGSSEGGLSDGGPSNVQHVQNVSYCLLIIMCYQML